MRSTGSSSGRQTRILTPRWLAVFLSFIWLSFIWFGIGGHTSLARDINDLSRVQQGHDHSIGIIAGGSDRKLIASNDSSESTPSSSKKAHKEKPAAKPPAARVTKEAAVEIALKKVPGEVTDVAIEKKRGRKVYVVEIIAADGGKETDVFVDTSTGEVIGTD